MLLAPLLLIASASAPPKADLAELFKRIHGSVFEVVVPKRSDTTTRYAEPLPLDLLPYRVRKDSVWSIGSAFAVGKDTVLTAAHVMQLGEGDSLQEPRLRDSEGRILRIGRLLKLSSHEDFALFLVPGLSVKKPIRPARNPAIGQSVFAVGNALGEGIVVREGLLTSRTPEPENGEWMHWRFSAAASPGNSGGPLVDAQGALVGVVLMKSESENLNYALPWSVVAAFHPDTARYRFRWSYAPPSLPDVSAPALADTMFRIPGTWRKLDSILSLVQDDRFRRHRAEWISEHSNMLFPHGRPGKACRTPLVTDLPTSLARANDGWWMLDSRKAEASSDLGRNGLWVSRTEQGLTRAVLRIPDTASLADLVRDSRRLGDLILMGGRMDREIADKSVRVTSLGASVQDTSIRDRWGRTWLGRTWLRRWDGSRMVARLLPGPNGFQVLLYVARTASDEQLHSRLIDDIADQTIAGWGGTRDQWVQWRKLDELVPDFLSAVSFSNRWPSAVWPSGALSMDTAIAPDSKEVRYGVYPKFKPVAKDSVVMDMGMFVIASNLDSHRGVSLMWVGPPYDDASAALTTDWNRLVAGDPPYDGSAQNQGGGKLVANALHPDSREAERLDTTRTTPAWVVSVMLDGIPKDDKIQSIVQRTLRSARVPREEPSPWAVRP